MKSRHRALFETLLRTFPRHFRREFGEGMRDTFAETYAEHRAKGRWRLSMFLCTTAVDMTASGLRERMKPSMPSAASHSGLGSSLVQDLRLAVRTLSRSPGFSAAVVLTLGMGIGGATALFSVVDGVLLRPLPYDEPDRLVQLWQQNGPDRRSSFSAANFADVEAASVSFEALAAYQAGTTPVALQGRVARVGVTAVSEGFFDVLRVEPVLGRGMLPEELASDAPVMVVDETFWRNELGADRDLDGLSARIGDRVYSIVGVLPERVAFPAGTGAWIPRTVSPLERRTGHNWQVVGRLAPDTNLETARAELGEIAAELKSRFGSDTAMTDVSAVPLHEQLVGRVRASLLILLGAAGFLLVVACANALSLLLSRSAAQSMEIAIRRAIGADRIRIVRHFLTEALVLCLAGAALGLILARFGVAGLLAIEPGNLPRSEGIGVDGVVLAFALTASFATAALLGLVTSTRAMGGRLHETLSEAGRTRSGGTRTQRVRSTLATLQVAMTFVLLVGTGLLVRSVMRLSAVDPGYRTSGVVVVDVFLPSTTVQGSPSDVARIRDALLEGARSIPGVSRVGLASVFPLGGRGSNGYFLVMDRPDQVQDLDDYERLSRDRTRLGEANYRAATTDYFRAMEIPLVRGRLFDERDGPEDIHAAVISESLAERQWPGEDPIGRYIQYGNMDADVRSFVIVGVVGDVRERGLDSDPLPTFYGNGMQRTAALRGSFSLVLVAEDPGAVAPAAQAALRRAAPDVPVRISTVEDLLSDSMAQRRFSLILLAAFAAVAVLLAVTGIYGVVSYLVTQQRREWAIRLALGASRASVLGRVLASGLGLIAIGLFLGAGVALSTTRVLQGLLFGIAPSDLPTLAAVAALLVATSLVASAVPAARATRIDPALAMRE
jgi:predicted permease